MAEENKTSGILARQRETMATIQSGLTVRLVPTPAEIEEARVSLEQTCPKPLNNFRRSSSVPRPSRPTQNSAS
jgi:hypothetical protein